MSDERQVILISGGSRGLGQALVADLLARGHIVTTFSRSCTPFIEACQAADPAGESFVWEAIDSTNSAEVQRFVLAMARRYRRIDGLINNAAVAAEGVLALMPMPDIQQVLAVNLAAAITLAQVAARVMLARGHGRIINISSIMGLRGHSGLSVYSATKAGLDGLTRSLARELGSRGITVNGVAPGYLETELSASLGEAQRAQIVRRTPLGRLGTTADVVGVIRFLLSPDARFITGQTLVVDGGMTC